MSNQSSMTPSCDTWVALKDATRDGSVILAKNSDRPPMEAQPLVQAPRCEYEPGAMVKCTHIEIPQSSVTYAHIGSKIWWTFGYEHGMNEHGVAIGNEAVWSKERREEGVGLLGMDLIRLGLERGKSAYEAMHVMIELLQRYGQEGESEWPGEWGGARNDNSYIIADPNEAWVLETAGRYWVAKHLSQESIPSPTCTRSRRSGMRHTLSWCSTRSRKGGPGHRRASILLVIMATTGAQDRTIQE